MFFEITFHLAVCYSSYRSSYSCCYFVLPCCFFDFHGKYNRRQSKKTQYREYLDFVAEVGSVCGFHVEEDCLRIPSTKRVILQCLGLLCFLGFFKAARCLKHVDVCYCFFINCCCKVETICFEESIKILFSWLFCS